MTNPTTLVLLLLLLAVSTVVSQNSSVAPPKENKGSTPGMTKAASTKAPTKAPTEGPKQEQMEQKDQPANPGPSAEQPGGDSVPAGAEGSGASEEPPVDASSHVTGFATLLAATAYYLL